MNAQGESDTGGDATAEADSTGGETDAGRGGESTLSAALARLEEGCCVFVTGDVSTDAYRLAASRYFGAPERRRRRVLALTRAGEPERWLPDGVAPEETHAAVVRLDDAARDPAAGGVDPVAAEPDAGGTAVTGSRADAGTDPTGPDSLDLGAGGAASGATDDGNANADTDAAIDGSADTADGLESAEDSTAVPAARFTETLFSAMESVSAAEPASHSRLELRVGLYRVDGLYAALGEAAGEVLREVAARTRERGGMAHVHLPRPVGEEPRSDPVVSRVTEALGEQLDAVVLLRERETADAPEERWDIAEWGTTGWNDLA